VYPQDPTQLDDRWLALSIDGRDVGYVEFRAQTAGPGTSWEKKGHLGQLARVPTSVLIEEFHWAVLDDGSIGRFEEGWDSVIDKLDLSLDPLDSHALESGESVRWLGDDEVRYVSGAAR
jgi:hypothetical protein